MVYISSRDSSFSSCESKEKKSEENFFKIYTKNHYFHRVMAITTQSPFFLHFDAIFSSFIDICIIFTIF